jgi:hypothetical protein
VDLYGIIDVLAVGEGIVAVQATSGSNVSARVAKLTESDALPILRKAGSLRPGAWVAKGARAVAAAGG